MARGRGRACGKIILLGEHYAVHGGAALALPVTRRGLEVVVTSGRGEVTVQSEVARFIASGRAEAGVQAMLAALTLAADALSVEVRGDLPLGVGLGGSAALATALVRALRAAAMLESGTPEEALVHRLEGIAHGTPSGIDGAVICREQAALIASGVVASAALHPEWLQCPPWWIAVVPRAGTTRVAVAAVARLRGAEPDRYAQLAAASDKAVKRALEILAAPPDAPAVAELGSLMRAAHAGLAQLGVSTPALDGLVAAANAAGAYGAKLSGGGLGGAVIALAPTSSSQGAGLEFGRALYSAGAALVLAP